jgi:hypothetical protein
MQVPFLHGGLHTAAAVRMVSRREAACIRDVQEVPLQSAVHRHVPGAVHVPPLLQTGEQTAGQVESS